jgi:hypothetical protein
MNAGGTEQEQTTKRIIALSGFTNTKQQGPHFVVKIQSLKVIVVQFFEFLLREIFALPVFEIFHKGIGLVCTKILVRSKAKVGWKILHHAVSKIQLPAFVQSIPVKHLFTFYIACP